MRSKSKNDIEILSSKIVYDNFIKVQSYDLRYKLFDGGWSDVINRECTGKRKVSAVLPYEKKKKKVILIEQFRPGALESESSPWLLEIVAGFMEEGESPEMVAYRETKEETGLDIGGLTLITKFFPSPGGSSQFVYLYCAEVVSQNAGGIHGAIDENEDIKTHIVDIDKAFKMVKDGFIDNATTIIALQWLELNLISIR
jgi:ADP-ribose pyrophosphatase